MDKATRIRWAVLLSSLVLTVGAIFFPDVESTQSAVSAAAPRVNKAAAPLVSAAAPAPNTVDDDAPGENDPFAPRGWQAPPPPAPVMPAAQQLAVAPVDLTPPGPPALPFRFVGSFNDSSAQVVYLARGEEAFVARAGEIVDTNYKVVAITASQIEFEHIPTGAKQALTFPVRDN
jgi:hypothetical protein